MVKFRDAPPDKPKIPKPGEVNMPTMTTRRHIRQDRGGGDSRRDQINQLLATTGGE